ncbi:hypothetical protein V500_01727 [Pseudogymnoascus sp. VKM F-4518 (FW-2643)]|nr:hypothetical protein V500_01727 [Pseudogymnoascus sp. VKM F-4518 (FW-2643)]
MGDHSPQDFGRTDLGDRLATESFFKEHSAAPTVAESSIQQAKLLFMQESFPNSANNFLKVWRTLINEINEFKDVSTTFELEKVTKDDEIRTHLSYCVLCDVALACLRSGQYCYVDKNEGYALDLYACADGGLGDTTVKKIMVNDEYRPAGSKIREILQLEDAFGRMLKTEDNFIHAAGSIAKYCLTRYSGRLSRVEQPYYLRFATESLRWIYMVDGGAEGATNPNLVRILAAAEAMLRDAY